MAPKRNRSTRAESITAPTSYPEYATVQFRDEAQRENYEDLKNKTIGTISWPCENTLAQVGARDAVMGLLDHKDWQHLFFGLNEPTYLELTWEVLSSMDVPRKIHDNRAKVISFRGFDQEFSISANE
ncbi:unnamed protein product [Cuscuta epithymum]|uniref:Uncharacterized protein n=1 Tax=Cuscuta epithymum TaxID=186058 RepID=A0AAV0D2N7_9ASTE|nr:unnamed protein product [Cuscuta epithymum]CAH9121385.1 unnamed protein product [Cuscuta epithymum]